MKARFDYGWYRTYERAAAALEGFWAEGIVGEFDDPKIEKRGKGYAVTLLC